MVPPRKRDSLSLVILPLLLGGTLSFQTIAKFGISSLRSNNDLPLACFRCDLSEDAVTGNLVRGECGWSEKFKVDSTSLCGAREARIIAPLAAAFGSAFLGMTSPALAVGEGSFEESLKQYFPTASTSRKIASKVIGALRDRGFKWENTIFASSVCSDEINVINESPKCLVNELQDAFGDQSFVLGGLGGVPFVGKSGLGACVSHVPDEGKLLICYGPHVGLSEEGVVGDIRRKGKVKMSDACGAAIGAYKFISSKGKDNIKFVGDRPFDDEEEYIIQQLSKRLDIERVQDLALDPIAVVTYEMFGVVRELLFDAISGVPAIATKCSEVALVGGIIINQYNGEDYFQPLSFQVGKMDYFTEKLKFADVYEETFGPKPGTQLTAIVGGKARAGRLLVDMQP